jgi:hypothetical protein
MRKSKSVPLTLLATAALTGCNHQREVRNCVDAENHIVRDSLCKSPSPGAYGGGGSYHYVYGGASGGNLGDTVVHASDEPASGADIVSGETGDVVRGGFGSSEGGGESGGEGGVHGGGGEGGGE